MMKVFSYIFATIFIASIYLVSAAPTSSCANYRVTSPVNTFSATIGQCYQVSYDLSQVKGTHTITIELYSSTTNKKVSTLISNESTTGRIATSWFNMNAGSAHKSGNYYYLITFDGGKNCPSIKSPAINVIYNKNSPPSTCISS